MPENNNNNSIDRYNDKSIIQIIPQHASLIQQEESISKNPYNVTSWGLYLDEIDTILADYKTKKGATMSTSTSSFSCDATTMNLILLRDLIGRRAVFHLPKSYKLWKFHWEFVLKHEEAIIIGNGNGNGTTDGNGNGSNGGNQNIIFQMWERALVTLHKFPKVWVEYLKYAHDTFNNTSSSSSTSIATSTVISPTQLRRLANRALESLPVTQHDKIWPVLLQYYQTSPGRQQQQQESSPSSSSSFMMMTCEIPKETKLCMLRRYIQFNPAATKDIADFLVDSLGQWGEAALLYIQLLNDPILQQTQPIQQRQDLWMSLAKICTRHPVETNTTIGIDWDAMVRSVLANSSNSSSKNNNNNNSNNTGSSSGTAVTAVTSNFLPKELHGVLWNQLADAWIRRGEFQLARSVYEEAIESVMTVRDFTILFDAYLQFEQGLLEATMEAQQEDEEYAEGEEEGNEENYDKDDWDILVPQSQKRKNENGDVDDHDQDHDYRPKTTMADLELALARAEDLTARRPLLLNRVLLRQNPHDVGEWLKRARLYKEQEQVAQAAAALEEALRTVHARRAFGGSPCQIVLELVKIYENDCKDVAKARDLLDRICNQWVYEFKMTDDLAECHAAWAELELRQEAWDNALEIIRQSVIVPPNAPKMVRGLAKSLRLWDLVLDLEESLGTVQTTKDAYNRAIEQRVATPMHILNFASFLTEQKYYEEAFSAYERGIELFQYPGVKVIWKAFLDAFLKRYSGTKIERTRDLFQRCHEACPSEECAEFYIMNGKFEEEYGLTKRALGVYREMCQRVPPNEKYTAYQLFITKTIKYLGKTATRDIYQTAIEDLDDISAAKLCIDFAKMETSLQEIDRARTVLAYGAQMADPRRNDEYWKVWNEFEIAHGNEETFREMLRIKRSVEASFSTVNYNAAEMSTDGTASGGGAGGGIGGIGFAKSDVLSNEEAIRMIAEREGVELEQILDETTTTKPIQGFVPATKRTAQVANLEDVEERAAKIRKAAAAAVAETTTNNDDNNNNNDDADEIDIDDLDDDDDNDNDEDDNDNDNDEEAVIATTTTKQTVKDVSTKAIPAAVFGGLAKLVNEEEKTTTTTTTSTPKGALERFRAAQSND